MSGVATLTQKISGRNTWDKSLIQVHPTFALIGVGCVILPLDLGARIRLYDKPHL